jgi:hypothetical protein
VRTSRHSLDAALGALPAAFWMRLAGLFVNRPASFAATFLASTSSASARSRRTPAAESSRSSGSASSSPAR